MENGGLYSGHCIGGNGGAEADEANLSGRRTGHRKDFLNSFYGRFVRIVRRRWQLVTDDGATFLVKQIEICKRSPDVDANTKRGGHFQSPT